MDTDIHAMLQDAEDYLNGELLRITEEWPSEREHQGESMLMSAFSAVGAFGKDSGNGMPPVSVI